MGFFEDLEKCKGSLFPDQLSRLNETDEPTKKKPTKRRSKKKVEEPIIEEVKEVEEVEEVEEREE